MTIRGRLATILTLAAMTAVIFPGAALAKPAEDSCAAYRAIPFSTPVPDAFRTPGIHRFEWLATYSNPDGSTAEDLVQNSIRIDPDAPIYPNTVLLRLFRSTTLLANGEWIEVTAINPAQVAVFYIAADSVHGDDLFLDSIRIWLRFETSRNRWSPWTELEAGPETSYCNQESISAWKRTYGWS